MVHKHGKIHIDVKIVFTSMLTAALLLPAWFVQERSPSTTALSCCLTRLIWHSHSGEAGPLWNSGSGGGNASYSAHGARARQNSHGRQNSLCCHAGSSSAVTRVARGGILFGDGCGHCAALEGGHQCKFGHSDSALWNERCVLPQVLSFCGLNADFDLCSTLSARNCQDTLHVYC